MISAYHSLVKHRELLFMIASREIKVKYKQSVMGFMWAIFMPLVIVGAGMLVKYAFSRLSGNALTVEKIAMVSVKAAPWAFFVAAVRFSTNSLIGNKNLVTKIAFPKEIFPIAAVCSQLVDFLIASAVLLVILGFFGVGASIHLIWVPLLVLVLVIFAMGLGMILSAASLFFRDVKYLVEVGLTFAIFFTPVLYEISDLGASEWTWVLLLNPAAPLLEGMKDAIVAQRPPDLLWTLYSAVAAVSTLSIGYVGFKKLEPTFAESV